MRPKNWVFVVFLGFVGSNIVFRLCSDMIVWEPHDGAAEEGSPSGGSDDAPSSD